MWGSNKKEDDNNKKKGKAKSKDDEHDDSDSSEEVGGRRKKAEVAVWDWVDDIMEGIAEIYRMTTGCGYVCVAGVRNTAYPIKEFFVGIADSFKPQSTDAQMAAGNFSGVPTVNDE